MILAIDTASVLCAACVWDAAAGLERGRAVENIGKGHAERLMAVIADALHNAGASYADIDAIAVCVGPGSFTGIRVGVSAARGLALALGAPAHGVTSLSAIAEQARRSYPGRRILAAIDAKRDEIYVEDHSPDRVRIAGPLMIRTDEVSGLLAGDAPVLAGSGAPIIAAAFASEGLPFDMVDDDIATADIALYAALAAAGLTEGTPPRPLYLRGPDARPQAGFALPRRQ